jgi:glycosyltransferase involved in cell wall biosynthesis
LIGPLRNPALKSRMFPRQPISTVLQSDGKQAEIRVLTPMASVPFYHMVRGINRFNQRMLAHQIRHHVPGPLILLSMLPDSVDLIPHLAPIATFYDCVDDHGAFGGLTRLDVMDTLEASMAYASRTIFATADALVEKMQAFHSDVRLIPNAVELGHFAQTVQAEEHALLAQIPAPRVGFVGGIGAWLDFELLRGLAMARPDVQFVFIGPIEADVSSIRSLANVHLLGKQPYAQLPEFLAGFEVCLYPFANNKLTESVNPVKIYEYLAAGKEVIATPTREMHKFTEHVWLAPNLEAGLQALDAILHGKRKVAPQSVQPFLQKQTWQARALEMDAALLQSLPLREKR